MTHSTQTPTAKLPPQHFEVQALTQEQFDRIAGIAHKRWGLALGPAKRQLVTSRLSSHLRRHNMGVEEYLDRSETVADKDELLEFFDLLSTNVTSFFRDRSHFDYLERELLTGLSRGTLTLPGKRLRLWSAGCSTGCEPYTMAMVVYDLLGKQPGWDVQILATDLSTYALEEARAGAYDDDTVKDLPADLKARHFERRDGRWHAKSHLRAMVKTVRLNLMDQWPMNGPFDVIFCRNVMIYFDAPTRKKLVNRFAQLVRPGGVFAVGSAESLAGMDAPFRTVMPSLYVK
ncbi:MAG: protein-glutamate O-methyltransferase [Phycisphaerales bacterium]